MRTLLMASLSLALVTALLPASAGAQEKKKAPAKAEVAKNLPEMTLNRDLFSGAESRIAAMNNVNADCTSGPIPDIRIVTPPINGQSRLEQIDYPLERPQNDPRAHCIGKPVVALGVFYKSNESYVGPDTMVVDVDFKSGTVRRFIFRINVR